jgi:hypothetical protein
MSTKHRDLNEQRIYTGFLPVLAMLLNTQPQPSVDKIAAARMSTTVYVFPHPFLHNKIAMLPVLHKGTQAIPQRRSTV